MKRLKLLLLSSIGIILSLSANAGVSHRYDKINTELLKIPLPKMINMPAHTSHADDNRITCYNDYNTLNYVYHNAQVFAQGYIENTLRINDVYFLMIHLLNKNMFAATESSYIVLDCAKKYNLDNTAIVYLNTF